MLITGVPIERTRTAVEKYQLWVNAYDRNPENAGDYSVMGLPCSQNKEMVQLLTCNEYIAEELEGCEHHVEHPTTSPIGSML